jgi:3-oxoacyl-[acyl-carrier-protein] synthase III
MKRSDAKLLGVSPNPLSPRRFAIGGSAIYSPSRVIAAADLDTLTAQPAGTIAKRFGVRQRCWAEPHETSSFMGAKAAEAALAQAGWDPASLDVIIGASGVMEQPIPGNAVLVQRRLGLGASGIPAFDVNATCLSFLLAFDRVLAGFALGEWRRALIVSADIASAALDFSDPDASVLFADGAAAIALEADGPHVRLAHGFRSFGESADLCRLEAGGTRVRPDDDLDAFLARARFQMDGRAVFRATSRYFPPFLADLLARAGVAPDALDVIIPHQASAAALEHLKRALPDGARKTIDIFADTGNLIATSLPTALHIARERGALHSGEHALLIGSAAGISLGGAVIRW